MVKLTLSDIEVRLEKPHWSGNELRGQCPLCGSSTGFSATENGKLMIHCHACNADFKQFVELFSEGQVEIRLPVPRPSKPKPTPEQAATKAREIWEQALPADPRHPYLIKKGVKPLGLRQTSDGNLIVPIRNINGELTTLQRIDADGNKRFLPGGTKKACFCVLSDRPPDPDGTFYPCEGWATGASITESGVKGVVVVAFDAGNLFPVGKAFRQRYPEAKLIVCGDDDRFRKDETVKAPEETNAGHEKATAAALAFGGQVCFPSFKSDDDKPTDFNDLHCREGLEVVRTQIEASAIPKVVPEEATATQVHAAKIKSRIEKLARLDPITRDIERKKIIKECGISAKTVDAVLASAQKTKTEDSASIVSEVEPWPDEVDGANLLSRMSEEFSTFAIIPNNMSFVLALWAMLTYCYDLFRILPQIAIYSPEKRCGKSTVLEILQALVLRGLIASNISSAAVYRTIEKFKPCLIIDEADTFYKENVELQGICNSGHTKKTAFVIRVEGDSHEPARFSTWGPKVIALIGALKGTQHDRSIVVPMRRKLPGEQVQKLPFDLEEDCLEIRQQLVRWAADNKDKLLSISPKIPETGNDRQADNWYPLFAIAECVGGSWPEIVTNALLGIVEDTDDSDSIAIKLLRDIETVFTDIRMDKLSSEKIVDELKKLEDAPWSDWNYGRGLTQNALSRQLRHFKIKPFQQWVNGGNQRGYSLEQFQDSFKRYLSIPEPPIQSDRPLKACNCASFPDFESDRQKNLLTVEKPRKPLTRLSSNTLALETGEAGESSSQLVLNSDFYEVP